jgi:DASS family divalent anion:Na+ symporter
MMSTGLVIRRALPFVIAIGIWLIPVEGLTAPAWHLFAVFVASIAAVLLGAFPLLTSTMLAVAAVVLTDTISASKAFSGFANASVLLVIIAFLVAQAVVKSPPFSGRPLCDERPGVEARPWQPTGLESDSANDVNS